MASNNTHNNRRDPRLSYFYTNIKTSGSVSGVSTLKSDTVPMDDRLLDIISSTGDLPFIADQEADNVRLQREKREAKVAAKELHGGLDRTTQSLNNLMASYANPLRENNTISSDNVAIEQRHTKMRVEAATYTCEIRTMTTKIREMEEQSQAYKIENTKLRNHLTKLETELEFLRLRVRALESGQVQGRIPDNAVRA